ncbi:type IA DNA topoisomerase [Lactiplantibacillus mudanjiangensis]|uniref:DNA topoisomerase n=1 Tax=Lactiplantibacillus mudanjiangensis TaxID=1296538 RepID=A0A660E934_9LACO|nr:type IA DNA topoisomerase [Lactiplantibacillus mudanjiangensis]VDG25028.1 DNA topoisomerase III [Lactobacillus acidipiscis] [Lactiplantibacillus mudanjiangensis]VDG28957.1 DNA topoisomerase III [Lactobacillus acidipiscis] [Lactiplantibacillus mudanjiangensis]
MTTVILAEKPSQARSYIEAFKNSTKKQGYYAVSDPVLPNETFITYGFGHLVELATPEQYDTKYKQWALSNLPIFPEKYKFTVPTDKKAQFKIVKDLLSKADTIIVATDSDREGENIAWSIMTQAKINFKSKEIKRLWINSLEKEAILKGFKELKNGWDYYPAYQEAQTRQISDWLVGMNGSPLYTLLLKEAGLHGVYSIGRVQTPTLYMVYQRDLAIQHFNPEPYFELKAEILAEQQKFVAKLDPYQRFKDEKGLLTFMSEKRLEKGSQSGLIKDVQKQTKKTSSPRLFSLSSLQSEINKRYHASASDTLQAVQNLYEAKFITYPRTDSNYITEQEFNYLVENLNGYLGFLSKDVSLNHQEPNKRYVNGKKVQEHHAIIMTKTVPTQEKLSKFPALEQRVYNLVLRTTLAMFADPYEFEETVIFTSIGDAVFKATGNVPKNQGWRVLFSDYKTEKTEEETTLPLVEVGQSISANLTPDQKMTKPPVPFTEGTLITAMKTAGKTLDDEEAQAILKDNEGIGTEATRANVLDVLKKRGYLFTEKNKLHVSQQGITLCKAVELEPLLTSPEMTAKWEKALKQISAKKRTQENFLEQIKKFVSKIIHDVPTQMKQSDSLTLQVASQKDTEQQAELNAQIGVCPICKTGKIVDKGKFYGCTNYKATDPCTFSLPKKWSEKALGKTAIKDLITKGETTKLKGFKSKKTGKKFDAKLTIKEGKLSFNFG